MNKKEKEVLQSQLNNEQKTLNELKQVYKKALDDINNNIAALQGRTDTENLQSIIYQTDYQKALKQQVEGILDELNTKQFNTVSEYLTNCYEDGFVGAMYNIQAQGVPLIFPIDQKQVVRALQTESKLSKSLYETLGEDVNLLKKRVSSNISRGIAQGSSYYEISKNIAAGMVGDYSKMRGGALSRAMTIARTEGHRISATSAYDAAVKSKEAGADVVKQWDAALDGRTRPEHAQLDGQIREIDEPFVSSNGHKAMYPGGFGIAALDINCRCAGLTRARWALDEDELQTLKDRAEYFGLDKTKDFEDFKQKYLEISKSASYNGIDGNAVKLQINLFDKSDPLFLDTFSIEEEYGFEDVCLHGSPSSVQTNIDGKLKNMTATEFASYLKESTSYNGGDIRLAACATGQGENSFAQQLSKELGVRVKAPNDDVYYIPESGALFVGSPYSNVGNWRIFNNGVEEK